MNPGVYKLKLEREEVKEKKKARVDEILEKVQKEFQFLKYSSLKNFAEKLQQREQEKFAAQ